MYRPSVQSRTIFEDEDIIVLSKLPGVLTIPDRYRKDLPNLRDELKTKYGNIFVVHRLDRDTSGLMVFAKNAQAHRNLNIQFDNVSVKKVYHCIVSGVVLKEEIEIDIPLMNDPETPGKTKPSIRGKSSLTLLKVLNRFRNSTLVKCLLVTGRHHQIRVHCATIGHPLLVDPLYGNLSEFYLSQIKRRYKLKKGEVEKPIITRVTMHSMVIGFTHPITGAELEFTDENPKDFVALLQVLDKYSSSSINK